MIHFDENKNIYIYSENVDMRMGLPKIQLMVAMNFTKIEIRHFSLFAVESQFQSTFSKIQTRSMMVLKNKIYNIII